MPQIQRLGAKQRAPWNPEIIRYAGMYLIIYGTLDRDVVLNYTSLCVVCVPQRKATLCWGGAGDGAEGKRKFGFSLTGNIGK